MTQVEKLSYLLNLSGLKAEQAIHLGLVDPTDGEAQYKIYMAAFGVKAVAEQARTAANRRLANECERRAKARSTARR